VVQIVALHPRVSLTGSPFSLLEIIAQRKLPVSQINNQSLPEQVKFVPEKKKKRSP